MAVAQPKVHIDAIQTVTPAKATEPILSRPIITSTVAAEDVPDFLLRSRFRLVAYYENAPGGDGSVHGFVARLKESLNAALGEHSLFAARLRHRNKGDGLEVRSNDSGARLVQATADIRFADLLGTKGREQALAYWTDVDQSRPQFSALFYVQVTSFEGIGYSVGLSCSLLLADPPLVAGFLKSWARIHTRMLAQDQFTKLPIFRLSQYQRPGLGTHLKSIPLDAAPQTANPLHNTVLFRLPAGSADHAAAALACYGAAAEANGGDHAEGFSTVAHVEFDVQVESEPVRREGRNSAASGEIKVARWDEVAGVEELPFGEGSDPVHVSYHIDSSQGVVLLMPGVGRDGGFYVCATVPKKK